MGIEMKYVTFFLVLAVFVLVRETDAATYIVGDSLGWTIPSGGASAYATWAAKNKYTPGDILVFNYAAGVHDVATVTMAAYDSCSSTSPLSLQTISPTNITLTTAGTYYFICTFGTHCSLGQKLTLTVGSTSAATPSTSPPPVSATPPPAVTTKPPTAAATPPAVTTKPPTAAATPPSMTTNPPTAATSPTMPPTVTMPPTTAPTMPPTAAASPAPGTGAPSSGPNGSSANTPNGTPSAGPPAPNGAGDSASPPAPNSSTRKGVTMLVVVFGVVVTGAII